MSKAENDMVSGMFVQAALSSFAGVIIVLCAYVSFTYISDTRIQIGLMKWLAPAGGAVGCTIGVVANLPRLRHATRLLTTSTIVTLTISLIIGTIVYPLVMMFAFLSPDEWWRPKAIVAFVGQGIVLALILGLPMGLALGGLRILRARLWGRALPADDSDCSLHEDHKA